MYNEGRELPHRGHGVCHRERLKRRTDKARRAHGKEMVEAELRNSDQADRSPSSV